MGKKVYRSLFDSDDVFEVEELTDEPAPTNPAEPAGGAGNPVHTVDECWDAIEQLTKKVDDALCGGNRVKDGEDPDNSTKGKEGETTVKATDEDPDADDKSGDDASKDVKDSYSVFAKVGDSKKLDPAVGAQIAFQERYEKVANK